MRSNPEAEEQRMSSLMRSALGGDEDDYAEFLRSAASKVRAMVRRKLGTTGADELEDVVQETLLAIHLKRRTWRQHQPILPWLHAIAGYKVIDSFRRRGRRLFVDIADFTEVLSAPEPTETYDGSIERALQYLTAGQRRIVSSIAIEGNSIRQTAEALGMKETAVRVAFHRALGALSARQGRV
jgi:RNA polymerase sigma-70 factor (ECF subfamily)